MIKDYLFGYIEDNVFLVTKNVVWIDGRNIRYGMAAIYRMHPIFSAVYFFLLKHLHPLVLYNSLTILTLLLVSFLSFTIFRRYFGKYISLLLSAAFVMSPYFYYHSRNHLELIQLWIFLIPLLILLKASTSIHYVILGCILGIGTLINSYLGFFTIIFIVIFLLSKFLSLETKKSFILNFVKSLFLVFIPFLLVVTIFAYPVLKANFINRLSLVDSSEIDSTLIVERNLENFFYFTTRPWYYVLPSVDNPFFGGVTQKVLDWMEHDWGYFLTLNYFKSEHSVSFMGWAGILLSLLGIGYIKKHPDLKNRKEIIMLCIPALFFVLISLPPYFTVSGLKIYTPSYLMWLLFPMFRVLSRTGIFILFSLLILRGFGFIAIIEFLKEKFVSVKNKNMGNVVVIVVLVLLTLFNLAEFYIPFRFTDLHTTPKVYTYIKEHLPKDSIIALYPYSKTSDAVYWFQYLDPILINPLYKKRGDFNSAIFTKELPTSAGIQKAKEYGVDYVVYYYNEDANEIDFFNNSPLLTLISDINEEANTNKKTLFYSIEGVDETDSAFIYRIN